MEPKTLTAARVDVGMLVRRWSRELPRFLFIQHWRFIELLILVIAICIAAYLMTILFLLTPGSYKVPQRQLWGLDVQQLTKLEKWITSRDVEQKKGVLLERSDYFQNNQSILPKQ